MEVIDRKNIRIETWERGAGYTLASGSSSTAAAAVAYKLGLCDSFIAVHMPGGSLAIAFSHDFAATMTGPVTRICEGIMDMEMFEKKDVELI
jgi:diaminopimelate epimerase